MKLWQKKYYHPLNNLNQTQQNFYTILKFFGVVLTLFLPLSFKHYSIESYYYSSCTTLSPYSIVSYSFNCVTLNRVLLVWCRTTPSSPTITYWYDAGLLHRVLLLSIVLMQDYSIESYYYLLVWCRTTPSSPTSQCEVGARCPSTPAPGTHSSPSSSGTRTLTPI